jgi:ABC-type amino acid transport substrate-binding protein
MTRSCFAALLLLAALPAQAQLPRPVAVFANWSQPPKSSLDADGALSGYAIESASAVLREAQIEHAFVAAPYPRAFERLKACDGMMVGVFRSPEREAYLAFSDPIVFDHVALVSRAREPYENAAQLKGKSLTYLSGAWFGVDLARFSALRLEQVSSFEVMLKKLLARRTDAVVISPREGVAIAARNAGVPMAQLHIAAQPLAVVGNHIAVCKSDPALVAALDRINRAIGRIQATGAFERIMGLPEKGGR